MEWNKMKSKEIILDKMKYNEKSAKLMWNKKKFFAL